MKVIYIIIFFTLPSLVFAQNLATSKNFGSKKKAGFNSDPFASYMLEVDTPCNDHQYLELRNKSLDTMSDSEQAVFSQKIEACQNYLNKIEESRSENHEADIKNGQSNPMKPYILAGGIIVVTVFVIFAV